MRRVKERWGKTSPDNFTVKTLDVPNLTAIRIQEICQGDHRQNLIAYAWVRLYRMRVAATNARDVVQCAFERILLGMATDAGRKPRTEDVATLGAFTNYTRGIISSLVEALSRRERVQPIDDGREPAEAATVTPALAAEINDLKETLFKQLRQRAPRRLLPTIRAWEEVFADADRIPAVNGSRKHAHEVRRLARRIVVELGGIR
jgi:hypothetical protein